MKPYFVELTRNDKKELINLAHIVYVNAVDEHARLYEHGDASANYYDVDESLDVVKAMIDLACGIHYPGE